MNEYHEANREGWDASAKAGFGQVDGSRSWQECSRDASAFFAPQEMKWLGGVSGKKACVLGSGDNLAVFALACLGADVTSVDISQEQLDIAERRATQLGTPIAFIRADVVDLSVIPDDSFDLVYTGGHVAVWVADLRQYYREAVRILRPGGLFLVNEYHPFRRVWEECRDSLELASGYFDRGPHQWDRSGDVPDAEPGSLPAYEFHWTVSEFIAAAVEAGTELLAVDEFGDASEGWERAPLAGLPQCLMIVARKEAISNTPDAADGR